MLLRSYIGLRYVYTYIYTDALRIEAGEILIRKHLSLIRHLFSLSLSSRIRCVCIYITRPRVTQEKSSRISRLLRIVGRVKDSGRNYEIVIIHLCTQAAAALLFHEL